MASDIIRFFGLKKASTVFAVLALVQKARGKSLSLPFSAAAFVVAYRSVRNATASLLPSSESSAVLIVKKYGPGAAAGLVACCIDPSLASSLWIVWMWIRAARFRLPPIVPHADVLAGSLAAGVNLSTFLWDYRELMPAYSAFLAQCGGTNGQGLSVLPRIRLAQDLPRLPQFCHIIHPKESCSRFAINSFVQGSAFGAYVQIPLHVVAFFSRSSSSLSSTAQSLLRAVLFLGLYPSLAMVIMCQWWRISGRTSETRNVLTALGSLVGITLWVESRGRRKEIACFTLTHAILSVWRRWFGLRPLKDHLWQRVASALLFTGAVSVLMDTPDAVPNVVWWSVKDDEGRQKK